MEDGKKSNEAKPVEQQSSSDALGASKRGVDENFSHSVPGQHLWRGHMYNDMIPRDTLDKLAGFEIMTDDCIVSGYPKSGRLA